MVTLAADKVFQPRRRSSRSAKLFRRVVRRGPELSVETVEVASFDFAMEPAPERELVSVAAAQREDAAPYTKNGIRFSSAFASEY
jgi:hypothetical protein